MGYWYIHFKILLPVIRTLYLRENIREDRWVFFETKRVQKQKCLGNTGLDLPNVSVSTFDLFTLKKNYFPHVH